MNEVLHFVSNIFMLISLVALIGIFKPFIKNTTRVHYVIVFLVLCAVGGLIEPPPTKEELQQQAAEAAKEAAEQEIRDKEAAKQALANARDSNRRNMALSAKMTITDAARNPDSVSFAYVGVNEDASLVCVRYRAQNGFGGMNVDTVAFLNGNPNQTASFWNKRCANTSLYTY
jgi:Na+-translocating ferredoxin:NAD+ oxidoreductase RnfG subunit